MPAILIEFERPLLLWCAAAALIPWIGVFRLRRPGLRRLARPLVRSAALGLLAAALAQPRLTGDGGRVAVFTDVSASQAGLAAALSPPPTWRSEAYIFAGDVGRAGESIDPTRTLAAPAAAMLRDGGDQWDAAVVFTDGWFDDVNSLSASAPDDAPVFIVGRAPSGADARVVDLAVEPAGDGRERLTATFGASEDLERTVRITRIGRAEPLLLRRVRLAAGEAATLRVMDVPPADRPGTYRAEVLEADRIGENNTLAAIAAPPRPAVLWTAAAGSLAPEEIDLAGVRTIAPSAFPSTLEGLLGYTAVVVVDADGTALAPGARARLAEYVRLGGGLVLLGAGPHGSPAERDDPLNGVLPLLTAPQERTHLDVTVLLDASASMGESAGDVGGGERKFDLVRQATTTMARRQLAEGDFLRVATFTSKATERFADVVNVASLDRLAESLRAVRPVGGTRVSGAMAWALEGEPREGDRVVLILSDLQTERFNAPRWAKRFAAAEAAVAVAAVGSPDAAAPLKRLADEAGGRFVLRADLAHLEDVFIQFLREARGDAMIRRREAVTPLAPLFDTGVTALPALDAHLAAAPQGPAEVLAATVGDDPLLARRRAGAGRSVALAAPMQGPWNGPWRRSAATAAILKAALRWVGAPGGDPRFDLALRRGAATAEVVVTARSDGRPINGLTLSVESAGRAGEVRRAPMTQVGPGRYRSEVAVARVEPVRLTVRRGGEAVVCTRAVPGGYSAEAAHWDISVDGLDRLARAVGGRVIDAASLAGRLRAVRRRQAADLWPWLLGAALALALGEWLVAGAAPGVERAA